MSSSMAVERREIHYRGRVQGVGFRYRTKRIARQYRVTGFVQNLSDGRVRLVVEGTLSEVGPFMAEIDRQMEHYIEDKVVEAQPAEESFRGFSIRV